MREYLQEIKHKAETENNHKNKTEHLQNRNVDTVDPLTTQMVPSMWKDVNSVWEDEPQGGIQK